MSFVPGIGAVQTAPFTVRTVQTIRGRRHMLKIENEKTTILSASLVQF
jgi:hypothetical protein